MAINYEQVGWDTSKYVNPTRMNHMDDGIKAACDKVDAHDQQIETINSNLSTLVKTKTMAVTTNAQGSFYLDLYQTNTILSLDDKSGHAYVIIPYWYQEHYYAVAFELFPSGLSLVKNTTISVTVKYIEEH